MISVINPYRYNRINVHFTDEKGKTVTNSYFCISEVIEMGDITFENFDDKKIT
jgi:hypothetical protein